MDTRYLKIIGGLLVIGVIGCCMIVYTGVNTADDDDVIGGIAGTAGKAMILVEAISLCILATLVVWLYNEHKR